MKSLRLLWTGPALLRLTTFAGNVLTICQLRAKEGEVNRTEAKGGAASASLGTSNFAQISLSFMLVLLVSIATQGASAQTSAQTKEKTFGDSILPLVYGSENTGSHFQAPVFPSFDRLPIIRPLPDPFQFANGLRDPWFMSWERRRNEIKAAIEKYEIGPKPDCSDCTITANYVPPPAGSTTGSLTVVVTRKGKSLTLSERVYLPQGMGNGPFPAVIAMTLAFPPYYVPAVPNYGSLPASVFAGLPVATIDFFHNDVANYAFSSPSDHTQDPFYQLYPELCAGVCTGTSNSGEYAAWAWGVSRLIDGIEIAARQSTNPLPIDVKHLAVTGCSYAGKMALFAGAFDERVALTIAQENGGGGAPSWRVSHEIEANGSVEKIDGTSYDWFGGQMKQFAADNVYKLPEDHDELMDMVAPRALLETGNTDYYWLSNRSNYVSARATQEVYNAFGIGDRFGFYIDGGHAHCGTLDAEAPALASFVNKFLLGKASVNSDVEVTPFPNLDTHRWTWWWGGDRNSDPKFPNDWTAGGTVVMSLDKLPGFWGLLDSPWIKSGDMVKASYQLSIPVAHPAATATLVSGNVQADVRCFDGSSYTMTIPLTAGQSYSIAANSRMPVPGLGTYQGSGKAPGCGSGSLGVLENAYFSSLGVSTGAGNAGGAGLQTSDTSDPLNVSFSCNAHGINTLPSFPLTVNFQ